MANGDWDAYVMMVTFHLTCKSEAPKRMRTCVSAAVRE